MKASAFLPAFTRLFRSSWNVFTCTGAWLAATICRSGALTIAQAVMPALVATSAPRNTARRWWRGRRRNFATEPRIDMQDLLDAGGAPGPLRKTRATAGAAHLRH